MSPAVRPDGMEWRKFTTLSALCALSMIKGADIQLLPSSFRAMEVDLGLKPVALATLMLCQGVACAAAGPTWGNLVDCGLSRKLMLKVGAFGWGTCTFSLAFASDFRAIVVLRILNGAALAVLLPVIQACVVDFTHRAERGYIFGWVSFFSGIGQVISCLLVTPISNQKVYGVDGWRFALMAVGALSLLLVVLVHLWVDELPRDWRPERMGLNQELKKFTRFMKIPTFAVIIMQGVFGTIPGAALTFLTMYFQYLGISDTVCALMNSLRIVGECCGGLLGGIIGDMLNARIPKYGRALTAQISVLSSLPCMYAIFIAVPRSVSFIGVYAGLLFLHGLIGSWVAPGCICPTICDTIPRRFLASAYAWELALVFCSGNTVGPLLVGWTSQKFFGYRLSTDQVTEMNSGDRQQNAEALGHALFFSCAIPYAMCAALFTLLYLTYAHDARAALAHDKSDESGNDTGGPAPATPETWLLARKPQPHQTASSQADKLGAPS